MVAAVRITGWTHINCFAQTLNLVVQEAIKNDPMSLLIKKKCKDIHSNIYSPKFINAAKNLPYVYTAPRLQEYDLVRIDLNQASSFTQQGPGRSLSN